MTTLLIRVQSPMQSWGISSHFHVRDTCREPTKSGIIGLICAAMGRSRDQSVYDLASLKMGVRVDREGKLMKDYHIAQDVYKAKGGKPKPSEPSDRYYLSDAVFLVGLEGNSKLLENIQNALKHPTWFLFFGRKSFPPSKPPWLFNGLRETDLLNALSEYPLLVNDGNTRLRLILEDDQGTIIRNDVPESFSKRKFIGRNLRVIFINHPGNTLKEVSNVSI